MPVPHRSLHLATVYVCFVFCFIHLPGRLNNILFSVHPHGGVALRSLDQSLMRDEIHCLYECTKLNNLRVKYMSSPGIRREPNVLHFVTIMQTNDPETIGNLAKFILHGLKLYT